MLAIHGVSIRLGIEVYNACYARCIYQIRDSNVIMLAIHGISIR